MVTLSRHNLLTLLAKLDGYPSNSACTIALPGVEGPELVVRAEENEAHYVAVEHHPVRCIQTRNLDCGKGDDDLGSGDTAGPPHWGCARQHRVDDSARAQARKAAAMPTALQVGDFGVWSDADGKRYMGAVTVID
jgi:hypothetical protein